MAMTVVISLAASGPAPCGPVVAAERSHSTHDTGMDAPRGPMASAVVSVAPATPAPSLSLMARAMASFHPLAWQRAAGRTVRVVDVPRPAPAILRI
jgi:hypothetical protein